MATGEAGGPVVSVLRVVEADLSIRPGAVTLLLQLMGGNTVRAIILSIFPATRKHVSSPADKYFFNPLKQLFSCRSS